MESSQAVVFVGQTKVVALVLQAHRWTSIESQEQCLLYDTKKSHLHMIYVFLMMTFIDIIIIDIIIEMIRFG